MTKSKSGGWISYAGRLIVGKVREWARLFAVAREIGALEDRRDELLLRLARRYYQYLVENRAEPVAAVAETVADVRVVVQRIAALNDLKRRIREDTFLYLHPEFAAEGPLLPASGPPSGGAAPRPSMIPPGAPPQSQARLPIEMIEQLPARRPSPVTAPGEVCACGQALPQDARFCPACGRPRSPEVVQASAQAPPRKCPYCAAELPAGAEFCPACGGHMDAEVYEM